MIVRPRFKYDPETSAEYLRRFLLARQIRLGHKHPAAAEPGYLQYMMSGQLWDDPDHTAGEDFSGELDHTASEEQEG